MLRPKAFHIGVIMLITIGSITPLVLVHTQNQPCPSGTGPGGIIAGGYAPQDLTQEQRQWLYEAFGHDGVAPVGYGGQACGENLPPPPPPASVATGCDTTEPGPGGILVGGYDPISLTREQRQWLWEKFGHPGYAPDGYGGEFCQQVNGPGTNAQPQGSQPSGGNNSSGGQRDTGSQPSGNNGYTTPQEQAPSSNQGSFVCTSASWFSPGMAMQVTTDELNVRSDVSTDATVLAEMYTGARFAIIDGPYCGSGYVWWQVEYGGIVGFAAEGSGRDLWIAPATEETATSNNSGSVQPSQNTDCSSTPSQRLVMGGYARVITDEVNLRNNPSLSGTILAKMYTGAQAQVIGNSICADGYRWWQMTYQGTTGWAADGDTTEGSYWEQVDSSSLQPDFSSEISVDDGSASLNLSIATTVELNICNPDCDIDHGNWIAFNLPANRYIDGTLRLHSYSLSGMVLTIRSIPLSAEARSNGVIYVRMGVSHTVLGVMMSSGLASINDLRDPANWWLTYQPK